MIDDCSRHEENREKEKDSVEEPGEKKHIRDLNLGAYVCRCTNMCKKTRVSSVLF